MNPRREDWSNRLELFLWSRSKRPFVWGKNDCCTFAADWIKECTGDSVDGKWRDSYSTALGALLYVLRAGGVSKIPLAFGLKPIPTTLAQRGDLVAVATPTGLALGICKGNVGCFPSKDGLINAKPIMYRKAWRI